MIQETELAVLDINQTQIFDAGTVRAGLDTTSSTSELYIVQNAEQDTYFSNESADEVIEVTNSVWTLRELLVAVHAGLITDTRFIRMLAKVMLTKPVQVKFEVEQDI